MRALIAIALAGCGFHPSGPAEVSDARALDAAHASDGTIDSITRDGTITPDSPPADIVFRQVNSAEDMAKSSETVVFKDDAQLAGDLNVIAIGWFHPGVLLSVSDSSHNTYALAIGPSPSADGQQSQSIYYACDIAAAAKGANTVTVTFAAGTQDPDVRIAEYSGLETTACLDTAVASTGTNTDVESATLTTTHAHELLLAADKVNGLTTTGDPNYVLRVNTGFGDIIEDLDASTIGSYHASAVQNQAGDWVMQLVGFIAR